MIFTKSGRLFVAAAALAATFFLALPAEAADGREGSPGMFEQLTAWVVESWEGWLQAAQTDGKPTSVDHEGGFVDPNGGGGRTGSCPGQGGCEGPPPGGTAKHAGS